MSFARNDYLSWYMPRIRTMDGAINLHASGVPMLQPRDVHAREGSPWSLAPLFEHALADWLGIDASEVLFTPGATGGTLLALLHLVERDREIVVEAPIYEPMLRQAERLARVRRFRREPADGWRLDPGRVRDLVSDRTGAVMITEPANPSGTMAGRDDVLAVADAAADAGAWLVVNEVYRGFTQAPSYHGERENVVVVSSLSKLLGTYWARLGWISALPDVVDRLHMAHMNMGMPTAPAAAVGLGVLERADALRARALDLSAQGLDAVSRWVTRTPGLSWTPPDGPGYGCVLLPGHVGDDVGFAERLHAEHGVLVVPGSHFEVPGSLRISWLQAGDDLDEGLTRIALALAAG